MKKFAILFLCFGFLAANATSWRVNNNPAIDADFSDLTTAIAAAAEGDTLYIEGTQFNYGDILLNKHLVLIGPGYFLDQNDSTQVNYNPAKLGLLEIDTVASGSHIYGLSFTGAVRMGGSDVVFSRNHLLYYSIQLAWGNHIIGCVISQNFLEGIGQSNYDAYNVLITNNYVDGGIDLNDDCTCTILNNVLGYKIDVFNSVIKNNITYGGNNGGVIVNENNVIEYNIMNYQSGAFPPGPGNIEGIDPDNVFVDLGGNLGYSEDAKWQLKEGSIAIGYGEGGVDCGMFGGSSPYILSGLPAVPHIYEAIVPASGSAASGLPVTIKVKSQN